MKILETRIALMILILMPAAALLEAQTAAPWIMKTKALRDRGLNAEAVTVAQEGLKSFPDSRLFVEAARAFTGLGNLSSAISNLNEANKLLPSSGDYYLAGIYAMKGDAETALYHLEQTMRTGFKRTERDILLDKSFARIENTPQWRQFWKKDWYSELEIKLAELSFLSSVGKISESDDLIVLLKKEYPGFDEVEFAAASVDAAAQRYPEAVKKLSGLLRDDPGNEKFLGLLAAVQYAAANFAGASATYSGLIDKGVADAGLYLKRAECFRQTGEYNKALADLEEYLRLYPGSSEALRMAGKTEAAAGDNLKAMEYYSKNINLKPGDPQAYADRGDAYFVAGSWEWASKDYSMSLDLDPGNGNVYLNRGIALLNMGKKDDACIDLRKALEKGNRRASELISRNCLK
ncbi:MAG: tetratricopeptide repeat protein [Bacteroidales bacterium]|jgi:tetratricopeptide (TPR) repeat protein|nr:tetratricopeptide repeat protein [Bacteroidales bacterium]